MTMRVQGAMGIYGKGVNLYQGVALRKRSQCCTSGKEARVRPEHAGHSCHLSFLCTSSLQQAIASIKMLCAEQL